MHEKLVLTLKISVTSADFWVKTVLILLNQNVSNLPVRSVYNGSIKKYWYIKLYMESCIIQIYLRILPIFLV